MSAVRKASRAGGAAATYSGRRDFRKGRAPVAVNLVVTAVFATGAVMTYQERGWTWVSIGLVGALLLGVGAIVESLVQRVQLTDEAIVMTDLRGRRRIPVEAIERVAEGKGVPTMLVLADGQAVKLPDVGNSLGNSIRAWMRADGPAARRPGTPPGAHD